MERLNRLALAIGAPLTLAAVLGGVAFAATDGGNTNTPGTDTVLAQEGEPTDEATPATPEATPKSDDGSGEGTDDGTKRGGRDCPEKDGAGSTDPGDASAPNDQF